MSQLSFSFSLDDNSSKFSLNSIIKLYLFRLIKGIKNYEKLKGYFNENEDEAFQLGFFKNINNIIELPPKRTFNNYLQTKISSEQKQQLNKIAEQIIFLATKNKIVLDLEVVKKTVREKKKTYERETKETIKLIKKLVYPQIDLKIKNNGKFTTKDLLDVLVHVAFTHDFANNGSKVCEDMYKEKQIPSGDLMMHHFSKFDSQEKLKKMFDRILDFIFDYCKRNYNILKFRKLDIAYDIHDVRYYGKPINYVCGGKFDRGTTNFFKFLTCSIVVAGKRFILDVIPIHPLDSIEKLLDTSLKRIKKKVKVNIAYLDRGFDKPKILNVLKQNKIHFITPKIKSLTVKAWFDKSEAIKSRVILNFQIGRGVEKALVNLVLVDDNHKIKRAFICNFDIAPCLAFRFYNWYSKRWGIETGYRNLEHDFKAKTTSTNYNIRLFYFLFSACLHNIWVLVNICIGLLIYGRIQNKPIITAKRFVVLLFIAKLEYFDSGG